MRRHPALIPLSHDHHHALVRARRARLAADADAGERLRAADETVRFFEAETLEHFREEEERLFPLLAGGGDPPTLVVRALTDHCVLHAAIERLREGLAGGEVPPEALRELGERLEAHVRLEERELFPLLEERAAASLAALEPHAAADASEIELVRAADLDGSGPLWGTATEDLNATLLAWGPGQATPDHVNAERDVLLAVLDGEGVLDVDGREHVLAAGTVVVIPKGCRRRVSAGAAGLRYVTAHLRRPPPQISRAGGS